MNVSMALNLSNNGFDNDLSGDIQNFSPFNKDENLSFKDLNNGEALKIAQNNKEANNTKKDNQNAQKENVKVYYSLY